jgi:hypothetical protein
MFIRFFPEILTNVNFYLRVRNMKDKPNNDVFFQHVVDGVREQTLEYLLYKINNYKTIEELKEAIKSDIASLHKHNMKTLEDVIKNGRS